MKLKLYIPLLTCIITTHSMANPMTATETRQNFIDGATASDIADAALKRIAAADKTYNAVIVAGGDEVVSRTKQLDELSVDERSKLPLAGVPILIKDNIETSEWPTTAGSLALADNRTNRDADLIARLRAAGAVILGKANLSEWANFRSEKSISGWSGIGGQARNAHDPTRSPCGSSSGSAAAVALGYVPVAIGSETDGSVVCPASINGVVGFKPTHGLVSGAGVVPLAASQDTAGPLATTVIDASFTLGAMIEATKENQPLIQNLLELQPKPDLKGVRVGVLAESQGFDIRRDKLLDAVIAEMTALGAEIVPGMQAKPYKEFNEDEYAVLLYEFKHQLNAYLAALPNDLKSLDLAGLIEFNKNSDVELSLFDQSIFIRAQELELTESAYQEKLAAIKKAARKDGLDLLLEDNNLDVLIGTTGGPGWTIDDINGDAFHGPSISSFPAVGGHPHLTVPMGDIRGMPVGVSFIGRRNQDAEIAAIAATWEATRKK